MLSFDGKICRYAKERFHIDTIRSASHWSFKLQFDWLTFKPLDRMRKKIEELKQPTIAEIKSYSDPPASVGEVMKATFLLLGESYNDIQVKF